MGVTSKKSDSKVDKIITYPCLLSSSERVVVLLTSSKEGTVVYSTDQISIGYYSENWNTDGWAPYLGSITLEGN